MTFLLRFLRKRFEASPQPLAPLDIPDDLRQAAEAFMQNHRTNALENTFLAHLSPDRVRINRGPGLQYSLETENMLPQHVLECWIWRGGCWQPCEVADFLAQRGQEEAMWREFGLWFTGGEATMVWQHYFQAIPNRRSGYGGTFILVPTPEGWMKSDKSGQAWRV
jgi:hypothetical protein